MSASFKDFSKLKSLKYVWHKGDCLDLLDSIPDESVQMVLTSPPYSVGKSYERGTGLAENLVFQESVLRDCIRVLKPGGSICWQVGNTYERSHNSKGFEISEQIPWDILLYRLFVDNGLKLRNRIIWHYEHGTHAKHKFSNRYETLMWFSKSEDYTFNLDAIRVPQKYPMKRSYKGPNKGRLSGHPDGKNPGDVWRITNIKNGHPEKVGAHPCQFPLGLAERCIKAFSSPGDFVLDPFGGVATTVVAALKNGRVPLSAEIDPSFHSDGNKRIAEIFGAPRVRAENKMFLSYVLSGSSEKFVAQ